MYNLESVQEIETHKAIWDFEIQTDHLISAWQANQLIVNKKKRTWLIADFGSPGRPQNKIKRKQKERRISEPC